ncbi:EF-hand domain-containing protein [Pseudoxanthomonas mexicana]|uniref:EF-hand domain-containing protein n=1 Tax=Pseudoxanthomonas mexicana TaxID=128785 RepID=UPI001FD64DE5|nr:EF-hand domain-containing protein [Pseudoxanthomonas mexicana]UOV06716.1 EF-hand domain-containing protein [Pseudoxanthomonas mexicana]
MTHTTPRIIVLAAACAMAAVAALPLAQAQEASRSADEVGAPHPAPAPSSPKPFEELDANGDGAISKDEAAIDPPWRRRSARWMPMPTAV